MRILTEVAPDIEQLFDSMNDLKSIRSSKRILLNKLLMVSDPGFDKKIHHSIGANLNPEVVSMILDLLDVTPRSENPAVRSIDAHVGLEFNPSRTFDDLAEDGELEKLFDSRSSTIQKGESRSDAFERSLFPLLGPAKRVDIADRYASSSLLDRKGNRSWLLTKLLDHEDLTICISTGLQENFPGEFKPEAERLAVLESKIGDIVSKNPRFKGKIHVDVFEVNKNIFHNRRVRFKYDHSEIAILLEKGFDTFASDPVSEQYALAPMRVGDFTTYLKTLRTQKLIARLNFT